MKILAPYQFTKGGSIIMVQIENEYASTKTAEFSPDKEYLRQLQRLMKSNGIVELLVTSDASANGYNGSLEDFLLTANFGSDPVSNFNYLKQVNNMFLLIFKIK